MDPGRVFLNQSGRASDKARESRLGRGLGFISGSARADEAALVDEAVVLVGPVAVAVTVRVRSFLRL
jgi:hypothetical protein